MRPPAPSADWDLPRLHPSQARVLLILLRRAGVDPDEALSASGLTAAALEASTRLVSFRVIRDLVAVLPPAGREGLGLALGELTPITGVGPGGAGMTASQTLDEALATLGELGGVRSRTLRFRYARSSDFAHVELVEAFDYAELRDVVLEAAAVQVCKLISAVLGQAPEGLEVHFPYRAPPWAARYTRHLPGAVAFGAPVFRVRIPSRELGRRGLSPDPRLRASALREARREAAELDSATRRELAPLIRSRLAEAGEDYPTLPSVAASLGVSPRTLIRRLKADGLSYRALVDETRAELACWRLRHTADSVEGIALDLGYREASNFSRSFRRWLGLTPSAYRREHRSTPDAY